MLGQPKNRFDKNQNQNPNQSLSVILKRAPPAHANLIVNKEMKESFTLNENVMACCEFKVETSGYYHVSSQITIKNVSTQPAHVEYLQFGICRKDMDDYKDNLKSMIKNSNCLGDYVIVDGLCSIVHFDKDQDYSMWVNFGSAEAASFEYQADYSNLRLYKL